MATSLLTFASTPASAELLLHFDFNSINGNAVPDVSGHANNGELKGTAAGKAAGAGVSGTSGDYAFNNSDSTFGSGTANTGGGVLVTTGLGNLTSFTVTMWYKADSVMPASNSARIFDLNGTPGGGDQGSLSLTPAGQLNGLGKTSEANEILKSSAEWVFVAFAFNGTDKTVRFYTGTSDASAPLVSLGGSTVTNTSLNFGGSGALLTFGSNTAYGRALDGWLDGIRVYGATSGASGALDASAIAQIRLDGLSSIPEPSTCVMLAGLLAIAGAIVGKFSQKTFSSRN
ncbi:anchor protein [Opitutaceae bacterium TAV5]|nr:anchor protein [Opitutaceae bacterium TAV5]